MQNITSKRKLGWQYFAILFIKEVSSEKLPQVKVSKGSLDPFTVPIALEAGIDICSSHVMK